MRQSSPLRTLLLSTVVVALAASTAFAGRVGVSWDPVPGATGYRIYYGERSGEYTASVDAGP